MAEAPAKKSKSIQAPKWWLNTYFWWSGAIFILSIGGLIKGVGVITDPGQRPEKYLVLVYFGAGVVMLINGLMSHSQAVQAYYAKVRSEDL